MATVGVEFRDVSKRFRDVDAVSSLSLHTEEGEFLVLVGPSGCGKTTALRMVAGLEEPTSGEIYIDGALVNGVHPRDRDIAMVFQSYALYPQMSVRENLAFGLKQRRTPRAEIEARVRDATEMLGITELLERKPKELSGGQRQRVALGRAIVRRPRVFLMDEPLSNLDAHLRLRMRAEIAALHRQLRTTFIYVTHDQVEAMTMGTRIAVMNRGVLQQVDTPQALYEAPANTFVATFIGSPSMNLLPGAITLDAAAEAATHASAAGHVPLAELGDGVLGGQAVLGIRPEHFERRPVPAGTPGALAGLVEHVETMGSDQYVTLKNEAQSLTVRLDPACKIALGDPIAVRPAPGRACLFDAVSGERIR
ncbi:MAG: ABC transporter ATP-binding protein [Dehalococcoidia bacterium]